MDDLTVVMLGRLVDAAGWRTRAVPVVASVGALIAALATQDPDLGDALEGKGVQVAVNKDLVRGDAPLAPGDEVAFLPPMSGG